MIRQDFHIERSYGTGTWACRHDWDGWIEGTNAERAAEHKRRRTILCPACEKKAAEYVAPRVAA